MTGLDCSICPVKAETTLLYYIMLILGIESSCDDTSVALLEADKGIFTIVSEKTASQIEIHKHYGGVVPEIAGRMHAEAIMPLIETVLKDKKPDIIAAATGPGLITGLIVGAEAGRTLSYLWDIPFVSVNHIDGHVHSVEIPHAESKKQRIEFPALCLVVSGGHTELLFTREHGSYELIGKTMDDAAGEAFDKVGKLLGFNYPGGPRISKEAKTGNPDAIPFPRPMLAKANSKASKQFYKKKYNFSFAGLKTAALYWLRDNTLSVTHPSAMATLPVGITGITGEGPTLQDFCASFEQAIVDVLSEKTARAIEEYKPNCLILGGGVSANPKLRSNLQNLGKNCGLEHILLPPPGYSMDNGAMIAVAGYYQTIKKQYTDWKNVKVNPNWEAYEENKN